MNLLHDALEAVKQSMPIGVCGRVAAVIGMSIEVNELPVPIDSTCTIETSTGIQHTAQTIGFRDGRTILMSLTGMDGISPGDRVRSLSGRPKVFCSEALLGRVINGLGLPMDGLSDLPPGSARRLDAKPLHALSRQNIRQRIDTGIRSVDALHTCGRGQRMGIFAGPGVGKSTLISTIAKNTSADVIVIALIGERGREVQEFIENSLGSVGLARSVVVVATGDEPPLMKVRATKVACTIAEYFRDTSRHVLLVVDSLTRLAQAQRQIGLAAKEPPATKGFPPSVFAMLPEVLERAGQSAVGSVTGFYTVLVEGEDFDEPIPDAVKGITDGHLLLSRNLAARGHFPAIDVLKSISRVRDDVVDPQHAAMARKVLDLWATYSAIEELISIGAYVKGQDSKRDLAVAAQPRIEAFLKQSREQRNNGQQAQQMLGELCAAIDALQASLNQASAPQARGR
jgi:flagellum-specific ATP synthase